MIKKCLSSDSSCIRECWKFWDNVDVLKNDLITNLSDTTINNIRYKRIRTIEQVNTEKGNIEFTKVAYLRCDLNKPLFMFNRSLSIKAGCAMVKFEEINQPKIYTDAYAEIEYLPNELTREELKIFTSWERNAKEYSKKQ
jgi:hypothetical protein